MKDETLIIIVGILCITILEIWAIHNEIDGAYLMPIVTAISSLIGGAVGIAVMVRRQHLPPSP